MENENSLLVKHSAHMLTLQGLTQWLYPVFENVFGREVRDKLYERRNPGPDFMNMDSLLGYVADEDDSSNFIHMNAALKWLNLRSKNKISDEQWQTVVLNNSELWLDNTKGFSLDFLMSCNTIWEYKFEQLLYNGEGLTVITGVRTNPMVPHYEDWSKVLPEWAPYPVHVFPAGFIPGDFGGRNYEWIIMIVPAIFKNVFKIMLALEPSAYTHKVDDVKILPVLETFKNDNSLMTELALTVPQTFNSEEAVLTSITLEAIVSKRLKKFLSYA